MLQTNARTLVCCPLSLSLFRSLSLSPTYLHCCFLQIKEMCHCVFLFEENRGWSFVWQFAVGESPSTHFQTKRAPEQSPMKASRAACGAWRWWRWWGLRWSCFTITHKGRSFFFRVLASFPPASVFLATDIPKSRLTSYEIHYPFHNWCNNGTSSKEFLLSHFKSENIRSFKLFQCKICPRDSFTPPIPFLVSFIFGFAPSQTLGGLKGQEKKSAFDIRFNTRRQRIIIAEVNVYARGQIAEMSYLERSRNARVGRGGS